MQERSFIHLRNVITAALALCAAPLFAATFVVPTDRTLIARSDAIVTGIALSSKAVPTTAGGIETMTSIAVQEVLKGNLSGSTLTIAEPGGVLRDRALIIDGVPRFTDGDRVLLFLRKTPDGWAATDLALGRFNFRSGRHGERLLVRPDDIYGFELNGTAHVERDRSEEKFLAFIRDEVAGRPSQSDYWSTAAATTAGPGATTTTSLGSNVGTTATFSPTTYTMGNTSNNDIGERWSVFPTQETFYNQNTLADAPNGGVTAIQSAVSTWTNDPGSTINYAYGGQNANAAGGLVSSDGINGVRFEVDLSRWGAAPYSCSSGGTVAIGGFWSSGTHTHPTTGETFNTITEGDVDVNIGIAACPTFASSGDFVTGVTHEFGHTLGFRHSNQDRIGGPCPSSYECSSTAVMNSVIVIGLNGALQQWDKDAAASVYPNLGGTTCTPPGITGGPSSTTITAGSSAQLMVSVSGTAPFTYQWYIGTSGNTSAPVGSNSNSLTVSPSSTTSYWVRVTNACGAVNSATATVTVNSSAPPPPAPAAIGRPMIGDFNGDGRSDILWRQPAAGGDAMWLMNGFTKSVGALLESASTDWDVVGLGDFNGDGRTDILWRNHNTGDNAMWLMNGTTKSVGSYIESVALGWTVAGVGDFNGDGRADILWRNQSSGTTVMWLMNGTTVSNRAVLESSPSNWYVAGVGDFNGDKRADILWRDPNTGANAMWLMNGFTKTAGSLLESAGTQWSVAGVGDFNGDGRADILWRDSAGDNAMWLMNGFTKTLGSYIESVAPGWVPEGLGDYNADGRVDIVWRNQSSGTNVMWLMNGTTISSRSTLETADSSWRIVP